MTYDGWVAKRGKSADHIVETTVPYAIPDISAYVIRVETWANGRPVAVLYDR